MEITPELYDFLKILISVLAGIIIKSLYDYCINKVLINRDKKFILNSLEIILINSPF